MENCKARGFDGIHIADNFFLEEERKNDHLIAATQPKSDRVQNHGSTVDASLGLMYGLRLNRRRT